MGVPSQQMSTLDGGLQGGRGAAAAADAVLLASGADFFSADSFAKKGTNTMVVSASLESVMYCLLWGVAG
jgi:hypothetical protein